MTLTLWLDSLVNASNYDLLSEYTKFTVDNINHNMTQNQFYT